MKKIYEFKLPHGWFGGHKKETDVICTIDSGISMWHTLILEELVDDNEITQRERVPIKNRTKMGYTMASEGDGIDISPRMIYHRGTVQKGMSQTIKTSCDVGVIEFWKK